MYMRYIQEQNEEYLLSRSMCLTISSHSTRTGCTALSGYLEHLISTVLTV